jgi:cytochrome c-type biogenesis protein CcmH/NrfF
MPYFGEKYAARMIDEMRSKGTTDAAIAAKKQEMEKMMASYDNPPINAATTFIESFPVGLLVTVSAAIPRKRRRHRQRA